MRKSQLPKNILIIRLSSLGDVVIASPIAQILKRYNPNARITWLVQPENKPAIENNPFIDEVICWDKDCWLTLFKQRKYATLWRATRELQKKLHEHNFDTAFDLQGLFKSGFLTWLSGAKERIGIGSREGSYWFMHKMVSRNIANRDQIGSDYRYLVNQMGYSDSDWPMIVHTSQPAITAANALLDKYVKTDKFAVICPFTTREQKQWPEEHWQQLLLRVRGRYQLKPIILGTNDETDTCETLARNTGAINLAGKTDLQEATHIMSRARLIIGVDNGLTHIAQTLDTPSIAMFGPSCPYLYSGNGSSKVLYMDLNCSPCRKPTCNKAYNCMKETTPDIVLGELKQLFKLSPLNIQTQDL